MDDFFHRISAYGLKAILCGCLLLLQVLSGCTCGPGRSVNDPVALLNVCEAPYFADPTGSSDSTEAILRALDDSAKKVLAAYRRGLAQVEALPAEGMHRHPDSAESYREDGEAVLVSTVHLPYIPTLYLPEGEYQVSDTLRYRVQGLINTYGFEINQQIRIRGAGVDKTVIRLKESCPGFGAGQRKAVISYIQSEQTNVATSNYCEDLTINTGVGNPGAVGLDFYANNSGAVRNVKIVSGDGTGHAGLQLGHGNYSGVLIKHLQVRGFDHGLHVDSQTGGMFAHGEDLDLQGQNVSAVTVGSISVSLRNLRTRDVPAALTCISDRGFVALIDSDLAGSGTLGIARQAGGLYVSNVSLSGFGDARRIDEWAYPKMFDAKGRNPMARLPIEDTPILVAEHNQQTGVRAFGAVGDGVHDDSAAIQAAFYSGAEEIHFEPGKYRLNRSVTIPSHIQRVNFNFCDLIAGDALAASDAEGFLITGGSDAAGLPPLLIERLLAWEQWKGEHCTFTHASARTVCFKDIQTQTLRLYRNTVPGGKVFFDNVATTTGVSPGTNGHGRCPVALKGQKAWARQLNPERGEPMILNDGGDLVLMGYKSEGVGIIVETINGGRTEVIGGVANLGRTGEVAFVATDAQMRLSTTTHGWRKVAYYRSALRHTINGKTTELDFEDMPTRRFDPSRGPQYMIPLYK